MELEQRVQALEQEIQLLKNQIQVTLLEIQEQLLNNRYPALRADAGTSSAQQPVSQSVENAATIPFTPRELELIQAATPTRPVRAPLAADEFDPEATIVAPPRRRREMVEHDDFDPRDRRIQRSQREPRDQQDNHSYRDNGNSRGHGHTRNNGNTRSNGNNSSASNLSSSKSSRGQAEQQSNSSIAETDWTSRADLEYWVSRRIKQAGVQRARQMIYDYGAKGYYSAKIRDDLLRFAEQYEPGNAVSTILVPEDNRSRESEHRSQQPAVNRVAHATDHSPERHNGHTGSTTPAASANRHNQPNSHHPKKGVSSHATNGKVPDQGAAQPHPDDPSEPGQSVVLRLIAGVANAGVGVTWRKKAKEQQENG